MRKKYCEQNIFIEYDEIDKVYFGYTCDVENDSYTVEYIRIFLI